MSGNYYKKVKTPPPPNSYGFKQVNAKELQEIIKRVTRATYSAKLHTEEPRQLNNYEHVLSETGRRNVASACSRRTVPSRISSATTSNSSSEGKSRRFTDREMSRIIRRLQRPTTATTLHSAVGDHNDITYDDQMKNFYSKLGNRPLSAATAKSIAKLRRPTTATIAKTLNTCHLCYDHENKKKPEELDAFDYDYCEDKVVPPEEMDYIVSRVSAPTHASNKGQHACAKTPVYIDEVKIRENLPLLSGLRRSKNVREITERLCPTRKRHGYALQATTVTTY